MKPHLPVRLFRVVVTQFGLVSGLFPIFSNLYATEYVAPLEALVIESIPHVNYSGYSVSSGDVALGGAICGDDDSTITLRNNGTVVFHENSVYSYTFRYASDGAAIYGGSNSTIVLSNNEVVDVCCNSSMRSSVYGNGAICGYTNSTIKLIDNGVLSFDDNIGGAIYGYDGSTITLDNNDVISFNGNTTEGGGAIAVCDNCTITLNNNDRVFFTANTASYSESGGAIHGGSNTEIKLNNNDMVSFSGNIGIAAIRGSSSNSTITLNDNVTVTFSENSGSAISGGTITLSGNATVTFSENSANAISGSTITLSGNGDVTFSENSGSAISGSSITLSENNSVTFSGNARAIYTAGNTCIQNNAVVSFDESSKGAIYGYGGSTITLSNNETVTFSGNTASDSGSAIYIDGNVCIQNCGIVSFVDNSDKTIYGTKSSTIALSGNDEVSFYGYDVAISSAGNISIQNNAVVFFSANYSGRAIYGSGSNKSIELSGNDEVSFIGNLASYGSAICVSASSITLSNNGTVDFIGNTASFYYGGAIHGETASTITLSENSSVTFSENSVSSDSGSSYGGAIYGYEGSTITLSNNETVTFSGNMASGFSSYGGAIYTQGNLHIRNNDSVEFAGNVEISDSGYRLRSIYTTSSVSLSAAEGKSIIFRDSLYSSSSVELNADYNGLKQKGDIIFTGATTEDDLLAVKGSAGTAGEIRASRTTEVLAMTNLYGGCLSVEDGAVYQGRGITVHEGSEATVRVTDATLNHSGYDLSFASGSKLEVLGDSSISGNVLLKGDASMNVEGSVTLDGGLSLSSGTLQGVTLANGSITGTGEGAVVKDASMQGTGITHALAGVKLENVQFVSGLTLLELTDVEFDDACMFSVGAEGTIVLNDALLCVTLPELGTGNEGVLYLDCTQLFHCTVEGDLKLSLDTAAVRAAGYRGVQVDFGSDANYETLTLNMNGATYTGNVGSMATFDVVPEPATATLSLLALAALASRRRRV